MLLVLVGSVCLVFGYVFGFFVRDLLDRLQYLEGMIQRLKREDTTPTSAILEPPLTPAERVARDQEELIERLNQSES